MVGKSYLRYVDGPSGGSIVSAASLMVEPALLTHQNVPTSAVFVPSLESLKVFSIKSGQLLSELTPREAKLPLEVSSLRLYNNPRQSTWSCLVGYVNGYVSLFQCAPENNNYGKPVCVFHEQGHKLDTAVLSLCMENSETNNNNNLFQAQSLCFSAGQDTNITAWDVTGRESVFRLQGHRGAIVGLETFANKNNNTLLVSASNDGLLKVWDYALKQCIQTVVTSDTAITSFSMLRPSPNRPHEEIRFFCGLRENFIKVYRLSAKEENETNKNAVHSVDTVMASETHLEEHGTLQRKYHTPVTHFHYSGHPNVDGKKQEQHFLLACTSKTVEVFRVNTREEVKKKVSRKQKRRREKTANDGTKKRKISEEDKADDGEEEKSDVEEEEDDTKEQHVQGAAEEYTLLRTFMFNDSDKKVRSACFIADPNLNNSSRKMKRMLDEDDQANTLHVLVVYNNNNMEVFTTSLTLTDRSGAPTYTLTDLKPKFNSIFGQKGHHTDIRGLHFVDNDTQLLSFSKEKLLLWGLSVRDDLLYNDQLQYLDNHDFQDANESGMANGNHLGKLTVLSSFVLADWLVSSGHPSTEVDIQCMAALSSAIVLLGLSDGTLLLLDSTSGEVLGSEIAFHNGGVKDICIKADESGVLTVGADRRLMSWTIGLASEAEKGEKGGKKKKQKQEESDNTSKARLIPFHEVELAELPLIVRISPDLRFIAVGLQNNNIQLFFADSLKPYLSLFGHKLPISGISFSSDSTLVASVSLDKNLRFWGTDFGDCHKSIHAHDDYITSVRFVDNTHYCFTTSLDGSVKEWDGDNWTMIQAFRSFSKGVQSCAVTVNNTCVVAAGQDKIIRCFLRTQEILFPQEEEEKLAMAAMEEEKVKQQAQQRLHDLTVDGMQVEATPGSLGSSAAAEAAERIMEALDLVSVEQQKRRNPEDTSAPNPLLWGKPNEWAYLWSVLERIKPSYIRHALLALTSTHVDVLLDYFERMFEEKEVQNYELAAKYIMILVLPSFGSSASRTRAAALLGEASEERSLLRLHRLRQHLARGLGEITRRSEYNAAALRVIVKYMSEAEKTTFYNLSMIQGHKKKYHTRALQEEKK